MTIRWIYRFIPVPVFYSDNLPEGVGGKFRGGLLVYWIKIRPKYRDDEGILQHELEHARQHFKTLGFLGVLCRFRWVRQWAEIQAYRVQLRYPPATKDSERYMRIYANFLATRYWLNITKQKAVLELKG